MALENIGDISDLVESSYGFHILLYAGDVAAGAVPFEDLRAVVTANVTKALMDEAFKAQVTLWLEKAKITTYISRMKVD